MKLTFKIFLILGIFSFGIVLGVFYERKKIIQPHILKIQEANSNYKYTAPLLGIDIAEIKYFPEYKDLESKISRIIEDYNKTKNIYSASVYYRNLNNSTWMGINETEAYSPGSLFKVPVMIAYLKQAEADPDILNEKIKFIDPRLKAEPQATPPSKEIEFGKTYTIEELLEYMIAYSDNNAANILASKIYLDANNSYTEMMRDLGLSVFAEQISAKDYSMFLRILYNATYLNAEMSEKALKILAKTEFKEGIIAGLPPGIEVSHKFGQFGFVEENKQYEEFHECGIIYAPSNLYLLCVMTKGDNAEIQKNLIKDISREIYQQTATKKD